MRERILGPIGGHYVAVTALAMGELADRYLGHAKVFAGRPTGFLQAGELQALETPTDHARVEDALDAAEDLAVLAARARPARPGGAALDSALWAIAYVSRAHRALTEAEVAGLLARSRERNAANGITGALLYFDECFMQYIEGPREALELVFWSIRHDPLHTGVIKTMKAPVPARVFPQWSMHFESPVLPLWGLPRSAPSLELAQAEDHGAQVRGMLAMFLHRHGALHELPAGPREAHATR